MGNCRGPSPGELPASRNQETPSKRLKRNKQRGRRKAHVAWWKQSKENVAVKRDGSPGPSVMAAERAARLGWKTDQWIWQHRGHCNLRRCVCSRSSVQSLSRVQLFATLWTAAHQASLSLTSSWSLPKLMSIESVMPSNHLILCHPLLLLPSILPSIRVFSNESALHSRWPKYWSFSFNISPSSEYSGLISFRMD